MLRPFRPTTGYMLVKTLPENAEDTLATERLAGTLLTSDKPMAKVIKTSSSRYGVGMYVLCAHTFAGYVQERGGDKLYILHERDVLGTVVDE